MQMPHFPATPVGGGGESKTWSCGTSYMYKTAGGHQRRSLHLPYTLCRQEKNHSSGTTNRRFAGRAEIAELMMPQQALPRKFLKQKKLFLFRV